VNRVRCFVIVHCHTSSYRLRRYVRYNAAGDQKCPGFGPGKFSFHNAETAEICSTADEPTKKYFCSRPPQIELTDPRWPTKCDQCDYLFADDDERQIFGEPIFRRADSPEDNPVSMLLSAAPAGALWRAAWLEEGSWRVGFDGQSWVCRLPDGSDWQIDSEASNCTRKGDRTHRCWVRHGIAPDFNIDKDGPTCDVGCGSIKSPGYHGFLRNGWLEESP